jgi:hypothetical protein
MVVFAVAVFPATLLAQEEKVLSMADNQEAIFCGHC